MTLAGATIGALAASAVLAAMIRPLHVGPVGFDSAASVIHFDRIVSGTRLEAFVTTTPKPLLTLVYGLTHAIVPDWRAISLITIGAFALAVIAGVLVVTRAVPGAPRWVAIVAIPLVLLGSPRLAVDVGLAYPVAWALVGWLAAGLAAMGPRPRPWIVGLALMLATLARLETVVVTGALALALIFEIARSLRRGTSPGPTIGRQAWDVRSLAIATAVAAMALPVMLIHDWLLTGDPWFWVSVSTAYSNASASVPTPREVVHAGAVILVARPIPVLLALIGLRALSREGRPLLVGLLALGPGLGAMLVLLAARGTYVSSRYYAGIEIALAVAAAVGATAIARAVVTRAQTTYAVRSTPSIAAAAIVSAFVVAASALGGPFAPLSASVSSAMRSQLATTRLGDLVVPIVAPLLAPESLVAGQPAPAEATPWLYVPGLLRPRLAVDLDLPLWAVAGMNPSILTPGSGVRPGSVIVHSHLDAPRGTYQVLETGGKVIVGSHRAETVATPEPGAWILLVN